MLVKKFGPEPGAGADAALTQTEETSTRLARYFSHYKVPFFQQYKVTEIDRIVHEFKDREHDLFYQLVQKYGPEPPIPVSTKPKPDVRTRLTTFLEKYSPSQLRGGVDEILAQYQGRENELFYTLEGQYNCIEPWKHRNAYRGALLRVYELHNPEKVGDVDILLSKYPTRQEEMVRRLREHYGVTDEQFAALMTLEKQHRETVASAEKVVTVFANERSASGGPKPTDAGPGPSLQDVQKALKDGVELLKGTPRVISSRDVLRLNASSLRAPPYRELVLSMLLTLDGEAAKDVDGLLREWRGREMELVASLREAQETRRAAAMAERRKEMAEESMDNQRHHLVMHEVVGALHEAEAIRPRVRREIAEITSRQHHDVGTLLTINVECGDGQNSFFPANSSFWRMLVKIAKDSARSCDGTRNTSLVKSSMDNSTLRMHNGVIGVIGVEWSSVMPHSVSVLDVGTGQDGTWHFYDSDAFWRQWERNVTSVL